MKGGEEKQKQQESRKRAKRTSVSDKSAYGAFTASSADVQLSADVGQEPTKREGWGGTGGGVVFSE